MTYTDESLWFFYKQKVNDILVLSLLLLGVPVKTLDAQSNDLKYAMIDT